MTQNKKFVAKRLKDSESNIVTKMWNIQSRLDDVIAMGRGDTDLDTPRHIIDAGINALNNGATHYTHPMGMLELRQEISNDILNGITRRTILQVSNDLKLKVEERPFDIEDTLDFFDMISDYIDKNNNISSQLHHCFTKSLNQLNK